MRLLKFVYVTLKLACIAWLAWLAIASLQTGSVARGMAFLACGVIAAAVTFGLIRLGEVWGSW